MTPRLVVELANDPPNVDPPAWTDHTGALRTPELGGTLLQVDRGRDDDTEPYDAGVGLLHLDNPDRTYDPRVGNIGPLTQVRVRLDRDGGPAPLFRGLVEGIHQVHVEAEDRYAEVRLIDALKWLAGVDVALVRPRESSGTRIEAVLYEVGWPPTLVSLDAGLVEVDPVGAEGDPEEDTALAFIAEAAAAEGGTFEAAPDGTLTFRDRHARLDLEPAATITVDATVEQAGSWDDERVVNVARVELADGRVFRYEDPAPIGVYGRRRHTTADLPVHPVEAEAAGMWDIFRFAEVHEQHAPVVFRVTDLDSPLLEIGHGDLVVLQRRWPDDTVDELDLIVEGVSHDVAAATWEMTWRLSPWWGDHDWLVVAEDEEDDVPGLDEGVAAP